MRIALVADIHGNLAALEAVATDIEHRGVDRVVNLGDNVSGPLLPLETAHFLMASGWVSISGNHDRQVLSLRPGEGGPSDEYAYSRLTGAELDWLRSLEPSVRLEEGLFACHGTPRSDTEYLLESIEGGGLRLAGPQEIADRLGGEDAQVIACGHTHTPRVVRTEDGRLLVNPGSVGLPAYDAENPVPHVVETGSPDARYAIVERTPEGWDALLVAVPYDYRPMARLAQRQGRPEWERALMTGRL
jgi:predicted phosphodiesterase